MVLVYRGCWVSSVDMVAGALPMSGLQGCGQEMVWGGCNHLNFKITTDIIYANPKSLFLSKGGGGVRD